MVDRAVAEHGLLRVRPGWVATPSANRVAVIAVCFGGRLTGATALRSHGIWAGSDLRVHIQVAPGGHIRWRAPDTPLAMFAAPLREYDHPAFSWVAAAAQPPTSAAWRVCVIDALARFCRQESDEQVIAALESAVHERRMSVTAAVALVNRLPRRIRRLRRRMTFIAESGLESIGRLRLEDLGFDCRQQVQIGQDRVDLVIEGWLVIEFDGDAWHDPVSDRRRTNRLIRAGYRVLRFGYFDVMDEWLNTLATIRALHGSSAPMAFLAAF